MNVFFYRSDPPCEIWQRSSNGTCCENEIICISWHPTRFTHRFTMMVYLFGAMLFNYRFIFNTGAWPPLCLRSWLRASGVSVRVGGKSRLQVRFTTMWCHFVWCFFCFLNQAVYQFPGFWFIWKNKTVYQSHIPSYKKLSLCIWNWNERVLCAVSVLVLT